MLIGRSPLELRQLQLDDPTVGPVLRAKEKGKKPELCGQSRAFQILVQQWEQIEIRDGLLFQIYENASGNLSWPQLVVPISLQKEILQELHGGVASGHLGEGKNSK